jgi:hypothetical protein
MHPSGGPAQDMTTLNNAASPRQKFEATCTDVDFPLIALATACVCHTTPPTA